MNDQLTITKSVFEEIFQHVCALGARPLVSRITMLDGPLEDISNRFRVISMPIYNNSLWIHVTAGAWIFNREIERVEFFIISKSNDLIFAEHLNMAAFFSATKSCIKLGNVIDLGRPLIEGSNLDHFLVSLPYTIGKSSNLWNLIP